MKKPKLKTCKICKCKFEPTRQLQPTCSEIECQIAYANKHLNKKAKEKTKVAYRAKKEFLGNDTSHLKKVAQKLVNEYVRLRDKNEGCISCGTYQGKFDAGHYMSAGGNGILRYNTINIRKQCFRCNRMLSANLKNYRINLIKKIGLEKVEELECTKGTRKYNAEYLNKLIRVFRKKIKKVKQD